MNRILLSLHMKVLTLIRPTAKFVAIMKATTFFTPRRQWNRWWRLVIFHPLLDFANQTITSENWKQVIHEAMDNEKIFKVTYLKDGKTKKAVLLGKNLQEELRNDFRGGPFKVPRNKEEREKEKDLDDLILTIIEKAKPILPRIGGQRASLQLTVDLQSKIRSLLSAIVSSDPFTKKQKMMLIEKISAFNGSKLKREAIIYPNGDVSFKSMEGVKVEDARKALLFETEHLLNELTIHAEFKRDKKSKIFPFDTVKHPFERLEPQIYEFPLRLRLCSCGCGKFYLQEGDREKLFIDDKHRKDFHNRKRVETGAAKKYQRAYRDEHPELKMTRKDEHCKKEEAKNG